ncbi:MAG: cyclic nucleotide-binding domain-containing protein [Deltaproteobacteria bacterium]|nr:MAG: cyclic nucleotide-binding domain-containing protein [Deltaproteobacteria bacterium]
MARFARWLVRYPVVFVAANLLVTAVLGVFALRIRIESSLESVLPAGDPKVEYYTRVRATFGSDDVGVVGVRADDIFAPATIGKIARVTDALGRISGVERVLSIANAVDPAEDVFKPPRLLPNIPPSSVEVQELKQKLRSTPLYGKNLVADDFKGAAINVFFRNLTDAEYLDLGIDEKIRGVLAAENGPERFFYTGAAHVKQAAVELMRRDLFRFTPIALVVILAVLWLSFWTVRGVVLPVVSVVMALVWTLGALVLDGKALTLGTFVLPPLLLVVGSSYAIHVMARYYEQVDLRAPRDELVMRAFMRVWLPLLISAVVTAIGFGSLGVNRITAIRDLGLFAVVGIACLTCTSLGFLPAALELLGTEPRTARSGKISPRLSRALTRLGQHAYASRAKILAGAAVLCVVGFLGALAIHVDSDFLYYFDEKSEVRVDTETINREIVGSNPFYIVIEGPSPGFLKRWEVLKEIKDLQKFLAGLPGITSSISLVDYMELLESGLNRTGAGDLVIDEDGNIVPAPKPRSFLEEPKNLEPVLSMIATSPATFKSVVTEDFGETNILVRTNLSGSRRIEETLARIRDWDAAHFPAEVRLHLTGNLVLLSGTASDIVKGQIESLSLALGIIFVVLALMFLSARIGFFAILPNVVPIVLFFGTMGWLGILLNLGTSLIAAIALGIAVDSTIHYMARLNLELRGETDQVAALVRTVRTVGVPIVYTTVALFLGFLTFGFSSFVPIQNFGILTGFTMAASLGANLVLLPALLATTKVITLWDLVGVKLGQEPARTIPLFAGLRPGQARIVVLMGELKRFAPGEMVVRRGELGDEMYVIIRGRAEVWAGDGQERRRVAEHRRGDVFGEMGLVRHTERSADVVAAGDLEVLAVDERFLRRIQLRYPRIASKVFLNLTRVLSDRLQRTTEQYVALVPEQRATAR